MSAGSTPLNIAASLQSGPAVGGVTSTGDFTGGDVVFGNKGSQWTTIAMIGAALVVAMFVFGKSNRKPKRRKSRKK
ncbi:hypothetical protein [Poriferisphaera sp. WC338]|uniref:hypothetical protein n=1 Tax=Poriferisphaera sp. WC338 TaxID=3425129 RepID=UPI003D81BD01